MEGGRVGRRRGGEEGGREGRREGRRDRYPGFAGGDPEHGDEGPVELAELVRRLPPPKVQSPTSVDTAQAREC